MSPVGRRAARPALCGALDRGGGLLDRAGSTSPPLLQSRPSLYNTPGPLAERLGTAGQRRTRAHPRGRIGEHFHRMDGNTAGVFRESLGAVWEHRVDRRWQGPKAITEEIAIDTGIGHGARRTAPHAGRTPPSPLG